MLKAIHVFFSTPSGQLSGRSNKERIKTRTAVIGIVTAWPLALVSSGRLTAK